MCAYWDSYRKVSRSYTKPKHRTYLVNTERRITTVRDSVTVGTEGH